MVAGSAFMGIFAFVPYYATAAHRLSTLASGMILTPRSIGVIAASAIMSFLSRRLGYRWPMVVGACTISSAAISFARAPAVGLSGARPGITEILALLMLVFGIGSGICSTRVQTALMLS